MSDPAGDPAGDPASDPAGEQSLRPVTEPAVEDAPGRHADRSGDVAEADPEVDPTAEPTFPRKPFLRTGYDRGAVDEFVTKVVLAVHEEKQTSVSADDVAGVRFPGRRFGHGYRVREVDDYLGAVEALLRMRATARGVGPDPVAAAGPHAKERRHHEHHPTWWIYGIAALLIVIIVVLTVTQG
jgi:DivIVA domain-containing protein